MRITIEIDSSETDLEAVAMAMEMLALGSKPTAGEYGGENSTLVERSGQPGAFIPRPIGFAPNPNE